MANVTQVRGLAHQNELPPATLVRDTRPLGTKIVDGLRSANIMVTVLCTLAGVTLMLPGVGGLVAVSFSQCWYFLLRGGLTTPAM